MPERLGVRHRVTGRALRGYRERAGYLLREAGAAAGCDQSKVSRFESGELAVQPGELAAMLELYDADPAVRDALLALCRVHGRGGWWDKFGGLQRGLLDLAVVEHAAKRVLVYAPLRMPELLWTKGYARMAITADPGVLARHQDQEVAAALARSDAVRERQTELAVVIGQAALLSGPGDRDVVRGQARHLVDVSEACPWVDIRVMPPGVRSHAARGAGGFTVAMLADEPSLGMVHVAGPGAGLWPDDQVGAYAGAFEGLLAVAMRPHESKAALRRLATAIGG